jgi:hypothetical protein
MVAAADGGRWTRVLEPGGVKRVAGGAVGEVAGGVGAFYRAGGGQLGAQLTAVNGAVSNGGGNGEGKQGAGEVKGAVAMIHFAMGGEGVLRRGGEQAAVATN